MQIQLQPRLQVATADGQFTFSRFAANASPEQLYELAECINAFQTSPMTYVHVIRTTSF
jgi:hypothetical protein